VQGLVGGLHVTLAVGDDQGEIRPGDDAGQRLVDALGHVPDRLARTGIGDLPSFDVIERLAVPLPVEMICHILGIDRSEYGRAKRWSAAFAAAAGGEFSSPAERNELMLAPSRNSVRTSSR